MKILFVWTGLTSYMGDCWRTLAARPDVDLRILLDVSSAVAQSVSFEAESVMRDLAYAIGGSRLLDGWRPDVIFAVGWRSALCRSVVLDGRLADVPKVCCFDMPWRWKLRCLAAPVVLGRFLRHYDAAFVPGAACARYARWLGFRKVFEGLFGIDTTRFERKAADAAPPGTYFLYLGRNSGEKRLDDLRRAHALYREGGGTLPLRLYGKGLEGGFAAPGDVPALLWGAAAFVLASDFDPWPLVLLEAMSAGCPVIASDRCTNRSELGRNWRVFPVGDVAALARLMREVEDAGRDVARRRVVDGENRELARRYDCRAWEGRVGKITEAVTRDA